MKINCTHHQWSVEYKAEADPWLQHKINQINIRSAMAVSSLTFIFILF